MSTTIQLSGSRETASTQPAKRPNRHGPYLRALAAIMKAISDLSIKEVNNEALTVLYTFARGINPKDVNVRYEDWFELKRLGSVAASPLELIKYVKHLLAKRARPGKLTADERKQANLIIRYSRSFTVLGPIRCAEVLERIADPKTKEGMAALDALKGISEDAKKCPKTKDRIRKKEKEAWEEADPMIRSAIHKMQRASPQERAAADHLQLALDSVMTPFRKARKERALVTGDAI